MLHAMGLQGARGCSAGVIMHACESSCHKQALPSCRASALTGSCVHPYIYELPHHGRCPRVHLRAVW